ncbi:flagellar protein FlgN [Bartonella bovis]|uniref:flagellar protein FlgN n=1 Tax=Bartonella bovis TaxID=155194 RepID=UPI000C9BA462|nr:flagellar protein FlgN [Bartonella bovis]
MSVAQCNDENVALKTKVLNNDLIGRDWAITKFMAAVKGLTEVVDYESNMLESHGIPDYEEVNLRKTRGLRDLNQSMKDVMRYMDQDVASKVESLLSDLQEKLLRNSELLQVHLEAVKELSQIMQTAVRAEETDGTYDPVLVNAGSRK